MPAWPFSIYANRPSGRIEETQRQREHRRLPSTVGPRNAEDLTTLNGHRKTFQRMRGAWRDEVPIIFGNFYEFDQLRFRFRDLGFLSKPPMSEYPHATELARGVAAQPQMGR